MSHHSWQMYTFVTILMRNCNKGFSWFVEKCQLFQMAFAQKVTSGKLSASEETILVTKFVCAAWEKVFLSGKHKPASYFQKTGCLLTLDGSGGKNWRMSRLQTSQSTCTCSWWWWYSSHFQKRLKNQMLIIQMLRMIMKWRLRKIQSLLANKHSLE